VSVPQRSGPSSRPTLLCVDDEPHVLAGLTDVLRRKFDVTTATSGSEGLHVLVDRGPFMLVMSDFAMPGMNGAQFLAQVRHAAPDTVRLLLTGQATLDDTIAAVNDGNIFRFLKKPCSPPDLIRVLEDGVEQARLVTADQRLIERKLEAMSGHLVRAERLASLGTMAGAVGHELKNILMVFEGTMSLIEEEVSSGVAPSLEGLKSLRQVQEHLTSHARNLLNFGRPARRSDSNTTDLQGAVTDVLDMLRNAGMLRQAQIRLDLPTEALVVPLSRSALEQVLVNLVKNAVDALTELQRPDPLIEVCVRRTPDDVVECSITDNGCGIPDAKLPLLFEPYYTTKPPERGTGLGLFVVRDIIRSAGGDVVAASPRGQGARFTLTIPVARVPAAIAATVARVPSRR